MNQTLNISRFWLLLKLYIAEHGRNYLISLMLLLGGMFLLMIPILGTKAYKDMLYILHVMALFGLMLGSSMFTSTAFNAYNNSSQGIPAIMLPASQIEKFLLILLYNLLFVLTAVLVFYGLHIGIIELANQNIPEGFRKYSLIPSNVGWFFGTFYFLVQGAVFLGSIYFTKNAYIMTLGIFTGVLVIAYLFNAFLVYQFTGYDHNITVFPFTSWTLFLDKKYTINYPEPIDDLIWVFLGLIVFAMWCITYVRLKEKQI
ncbi:hypothetical protein WJR50_06325 [Catalinimonas sp. 4WD22]|uniref:hypothetical protein n=1 Tax=Catalinimonas locisalis TaxID=3133978 RepID=UPI003101A629